MEPAEQTLASETTGADYSGERGTRASSASEHERHGEAAPGDGAGLAWLALSNGGALQARSRVRMSPGAPDYGTGSRAPSFSDAQQGADAVRSAAESSRQAGEQASEALGSAIRTASDQVAEGAWSLADAATSTVASTKARAGATADKLGAAVSTAAEAEVEDQLIGDASDRLKGQARNFAQEQYEKGKEMAQNAVHEAAEKAGDRVRAGLGDGDAGSPAESQETAGASNVGGASAVMNERGRAPAPSPSRSQLWPTFLTAVLLVLGFARPVNSASARRDAEVQNVAPGNRAGTPFEISARWKHILLEIYRDISRHRLLVISAGVTFYGLLAIFPAVAALVSLYGTFADPSTIAEHLNTLSGLFPGGAIEVLSDQMNRIGAQGGSTLGITSILGLAVSLWSANSGTKAIFDALNLVYGEEEKRGFVRLTLVSLAFTAAVIIFVLVALSAVVVVPLAINALGLKDAPTLLINVLRWPVLIPMVALLLASLYRYGPSREQGQWRYILWGSIIAALGWLVLSLLFSWYAANYGSFNKTYGSLGAVMGFMVWMWLSTVVILIGAELDAKMEQPPGASDR